MGAEPGQQEPRGIQGPAQSPTAALSRSQEASQPVLFGPQGMWPQFLLLLLQQLRRDQGRGQEGALLSGLLPEAQ